MITTFIKHKRVDRAKNAAAVLVANRWRKRPFAALCRLEASLSASHAHNAEKALIGNA